MILVFFKAAEQRNIKSMELSLPFSRELQIHQEQFSVYFSFEGQEKRNFKLPLGVGTPKLKQLSNELSESIFGHGE